MRIRRSKTAQNNTAGVCLAVSIDVFQVKQFGALGHVQAPVAELDSGGHK